jgi:SHS2 domain-containing protein
VGTSETFDHTADVGFRIKGRDLDDLFRTAAEGVFDYIVTNRQDIHITIDEHLSLLSGTAELLLIAWLNELIFRSETEHRLYKEFDVRVSNDGRSLDATLGGEPIDTARHILDHEVKAVTYHGLSLARTDEGWTAEVILDI